jgi:3-oxoacyl-[acyl-carrier protein] reductase
MRLEGKTALITGAGSGIGECIARLFAKEGANVAVADVNGAAAEAVAAGICADGGKAIFGHTDVTVGTDVEKMVRRTVEAFGGLSTLVNSAGITQQPCSSVEIDEATVDRMLAVNLKSLYYTTVFAVPQLRRMRAGASIVNIASVGGIRPRPGMAWYGASKGAVITLTDALAIELAPDQIRVNAIAPVRTDTPMIWHMAGGESQAKREQMGSAIPLGRIGRAMDMAWAALYLASDEAAFVTGQCLSIDGGRLLV